jgi:glycosyltransferase involved in cell wall biosynthesis
MNSNATVIICAYNEEKRIESILNNVCDTAVFNEVIVINDGSQDNTGMLIKNFRKTANIRGVHLLRNMGKGFAMAKGAELANNKYLVFIDADLSNFTEIHANKLINPLFEGMADMVLGQPTKTLIPQGINPFKKLSGQRAIMKKDIMPILDMMKSSGYGVETLINMHYKVNKKVVEYVSLENLSHPTKFQKTKPLKAIKEFMQEGWQIIVTIFSNLNMTIASNRIK